MEKTYTETDQIGQIVADDYRTAELFHSYGIDFCCNGNRSISEVCQTDGIEPNTLLKEINQLVTEKTDRGVHNYRVWELDALADYIEQIHHRYVEAQIPVIHRYLSKIVTVHGHAHPELKAIDELFKASAAELTVHMKKEELIVFPYVRKIAFSARNQTNLPTAAFGTIENPIATMMHDHDQEGERFRKIETLTNQYRPPADGCNTYKVTFQLLQEFQQDLHRHIHLENNILFPKAIEMAHRLKGK